LGPSCSEGQAKDDTEGDPVKLAELPLSRIEPDPEQPRKTFGPSALQDLAESIRHHGVLQPIRVRRCGLRYRIILGERRWRAAKIVGLTTIPAIVVTEQSAQREAQLVENLAREPMAPLEEAAALQGLVQAGREPEELGRQLGITRAPAEWVESRIRLLALIPMAREALRVTLLPLTSAMLLAKLPPDQQHRVFLAWRDSGGDARTTDPALTPKALMRLCRKLLRAEHEQEGLFAAPPPQPKERAMAGRFDELLGALEAVVQSAVTPEEAAVVVRILDAGLGPRLRRMDLAIQELCRVRRSIVAAQAERRAVTLLRRPAAVARGRAQRGRERRRAS
jgi:ParB family chromosome partitioning protein